MALSSEWKEEKNGITTRNPDSVLYIVEVYSCCCCWFSVVLRCRRHLIVNVGARQSSIAPCKTPLRNKLRKNTRNIYYYHTLPSPHSARSELERINHSRKKRTLLGTFYNFHSIHCELNISIIVAAVLQTFLLFSFRYVD